MYPFWDTTNTKSELNVPQYIKRNPYFSSQIACNARPWWWVHIPRTGWPLNFSATRFYSMRYVFMTWIHLLDNSRVLKCSTLSSVYCNIILFIMFRWSEGNEKSCAISQSGRSFCKYKKAFLLLERLRYESWKLKMRRLNERRSDQWSSHDHKLTSSRYTFTKSVRYPTLERSFLNILVSIT